MLTKVLITSAQLETQKYANRSAYTSEENLNNRETFISKPNVPATPPPSPPFFCSQQNMVPVGEVFPV
jgi:hypothetical protein